MVELLLVLAVGLLVGIALLLVAQLRRAPATEPAGAQDAVSAIEKSYERTERAIREEFERSRSETASSARIARSEVGQQLASLEAAIEARLKSVEQGNQQALERVRQTVEEKLEGTLQKRLGESFQLVSERLEQVYRGLGEMQQLASGVGDLKRVLTNVKTRGTWGEIQLGNLLEQMLSPGQYAANVDPKGTGERVEFAVRLPGRGESESDVVWLPIDAKFPQEDYHRLIDAQERADAAAADAASQKLESAIRHCARTIADKYLAPPHTTDFAIMFLPAEGLFAEVIRRSGLVEGIQRECRVVIAGPTTLAALLNSLQIGFRTLAIQERSSEVWGLLAAVKTEFTKYGEVLARVQQKLHEASETIDHEVARRTRVIQRRLSAVEELPAKRAESVLLFESAQAGGADEPD